MKKNLILVMAAVVALASCKSSESSYRKAYEKAQQAEQNQPKEVAKEVAEEVVEEVIEEEPAVTPVAEETVQADASIRSERLNTVTQGGVVKAYNVICGSFKSLDNANNLQRTLAQQGHNSQVAQNPETGMYRVIAESYDSKASAISSRDKLRSAYPDAWILYRYK